MLLLYWLELLIKNKTPLVGFCRKSWNQQKISAFPLRHDIIMSDNEGNKPEAAVPSAEAAHSDSADSDEGEGGPTTDIIRQFLSFGFGTSPTSDVEKVIPDLTLKGLCEHWRDHGFKKIVTMVGAGISTSAGIPDFRSPGSGLYNNLKKYKLPHPTAIFDMDYFKKNPTPFFTLAKELYPGSFVPTPAHYFVRLLHDKGLLVRHYTQNIDTLDRLTGLPDEKIIEAHGSFYTNHCLKCRKKYDMAWMKAQIFADNLPRCESCNGVVKPDIVFFGENLPAKFYTCPDVDFEDCDLLIIMGTSLEVQPFASLVERAGTRCIRLLINRDAVGQPSFAPWGGHGSLLYNKSNNSRDVAYLGDCDAGVEELATELGWDKEFKQLIKHERERLAEEQQKNSQPKPETSSTKPKQAVKSKANAKQ